MRHTWVRALSGAALAVGAVAVVLLWPSSLGGSTSFVTTHGISMEPWIHQGDLVLVRNASTFHVGEVAAYRSNTLHGSVVLHRIIGRDGTRYIFQGDNNKFVDPEHPTQQQMVGRLWVHVPRGGLITKDIRPVLPWLVGAVGLLSAAGTTHRSRKRRRPPAHLAPRGARLSSTRSWRTVTIASAACAGTCVLVGAVAFGQPTSKAGLDVQRYTQSASFGYDAPAPTGSVYPSGRVNSGDPVFLRLVDGLDVGVDYRFKTTAQHDVHGTIAMDAVVSDQTGWRRVIPLAAPTSFTGDKAHASAHLDLAQVRGLVADVQATTGVRSASERVSLVPTARVTGTVGQQEIDETYTPSLDFSLDALQLRVSSAKAKDPLHASEAAALSHVRSAPRHLTVPVVKQQVPVRTARTLAVLFGVPALASAAVGGVVLRRRLKGEVERIELRHGRRLVPVVGSPRSAHVVELTSMEDLARLAEQLGNLILHRATSHGHDYLVQAEGGMVYRYTAADHAGPTPKRAFEL